MISFLRFGVIGLVALLVAHWIAKIFLKSLKREALERQYDEEDGPTPEGREAYVEAGMRRYESSLRIKLLVLIYVIPALLVGVMLYLVNYA